MRFVGSLDDKRRQRGHGQSSQGALHKIFKNVKIVHNNNNSESSNLNALWKERTELEERNQRRIWQHLKWLLTEFCYKLVNGVMVLWISLIVYRHCSTDILKWSGYVSKRTTSFVFFLISRISNSGWPFWILWK